MLAVFKLMTICVCMRMHTYRLTVNLLQAFEIMSFITVVPEFNLYLKILVCACS